MVHKPDKVYSLELCCILFYLPIAILPYFPFTWYSLVYTKRHNHFLTSNPSNLNENVSNFLYRVCEQFNKIVKEIEQ